MNAAHAVAVHCGVHAVDVLTGADDLLHSTHRLVPRGELQRDRPPGLTGARVREEEEEEEEEQRKGGELTGFPSPIISTARVTESCADCTASFTARGPLVPGCEKKSKAFYPPPWFVLWRWGGKSAPS